MNIIRRSDLIDIPWKNGGGITREIAKAESNDDFLWRLSMADVSEEGPFSNFSGLKRILTVIAGGVMVLETPNGPLKAMLNEPVRFDGALEVRSRLKDGPIQDLNLIYNPRRCSGDVTFVQGPIKNSLGSASHMISAVFCTKGVVNVGPEIQLKEGDTAIACSAAISCEMDASASVLLVTVTSASV